MNEHYEPGSESNEAPKQVWTTPETEQGIRTQKDLHERLPDGSTVADALDAKYPKGWRFVEDEPMTQQADEAQARQERQADQIALNKITGNTASDTSNPYSRMEHGGVVVPWGHIEVALPTPDEEQE
jgi:hypothetical protein